MLHSIHLTKRAPTRGCARDVYYLADGRLNVNFVLYNKIEFYILILKLISGQQSRCEKISPIDVRLRDRGGSRKSGSSRVTGDNAARLFEFVENAIDAVAIPLAATVGWSGASRFERGGMTGHLLLERRRHGVRYSVGTMCISKGGGTATFLQFH